MSIFAKLDDVSDKLSDDDFFEEVSIVRCEDCRYAHKYCNTLRSVYCSMLGRTMGIDGFCSFGDRKDD